MMWEILAERIPYYFLSNPQAIIKYVYFEKGRPDVQDIKDNVDPEIVALMEKNWSEDKSMRMEFKEICTVLNGVLDNIS